MEDASISTAITTANYWVTITFIVTALQNPVLKPSQKTSEVKKLSVNYSKISEGEIALILIERDLAAQKVERYDEILNKIGESKGFSEAEKQKPQSPEIDEALFSCLKFEAQQGNKLGDYEIADKTQNNSEDWQKAFDILKKLNATIKDRAKGQNFSYWLYGDFERIYRQKRREK